MHTTTPTTQHTYTGHTLFTATCSCGASTYNGGTTYLTDQAARALHAHHTLHPYRPTRAPR